MENIWGGGRPLLIDRRWWPRCWANGGVRRKCTRYVGNGSSAPSIALGLCLLSGVVHSETRQLARDWPAGQERCPIAIGPKEIGANLLLHPGNVWNDWPVLSYAYAIFRCR